MAAVAAPAYAGHWVFTDTSSGSATVGTSKNTYTAPTGPSNNTITVKGIGIALSIPPSSSGTTQTITANANLSVVVKGVWTSDLTSDNTQPPSVLLSVKSSSTGYFQYSGPVQADQADDGYHDPTSSAGVSQTPGMIYPKAPGIPIVITLSLSAKVTATNGLASAGGTGATVSAMAGPITISVHAQPFGWYDVGWTDTNGAHHAGPLIDDMNGTLTFEYGWKSTDGILADLNGITIYEYLIYSGPGKFSADNKIFYPAAPASSGYNVPNGKAGTPFDASKLYAVDLISPFSTAPSLSAQTWNAAQKYEFDDPTTGEVGTVLYNAGNITDAVQLNPSQFRVSKSGYTAIKPL